MFPNGSDNHWGIFLTQVPTAELKDGVEVEKMSHEPLGFLSGTFRGSQQQCVTVDEEGFVIVSTFHRLEYLLWGGVRIYTDHRNLCVCVCVFFPFILDIKFVGRTSRGHTGGRSHRISHPPSFCGACLNFSREKDSAIPFPRRP